MRRFVVILLVVLPPAEAMAQYNPYAPVNAQPDPRVRPFYRRSVAFAGANSREFVEKYGDDAVAAIFACTQAGAETGGFLSVRRPGEAAGLLDFLKVVAIPGNGDDVVLWAAQHPKELTDTDNLDAFLLAPLEIVYALKSLDQAAAEAVAEGSLHKRLSRQPRYPSSNRSRRFRNSRWTTARLHGAAVPWSCWFCSSGGRSGRHREGWEFEAADSG